MKLFKSKKEQSNNTISAGLSPCMSGDDVINNSAQDLVQQIRCLVSATGDIYSELYLETLYRFAEFCQSMPWDKGSPAYSLLTQQLKLAMAALQLRRGMLLPNNAGAETIAQQEPQWTYAIFSASLLYQLHDVQQDRQIILHNAQGEQMSHWHPLTGSLFELNTYFSIQWQPPKEFISAITLQSALATRMISSSIIRWLSQNSALITTWWNAITCNTSSDKNNLIVALVQKAAESINYKVSKMDNVNSETEPQREYHDQIPNNYQKHENTNPVSSLLDYLHNKQASENTEITCLRIQAGLFICNNSLDDFVMTNTSLKNRNHFIDEIQSSLISEKDQYDFRYRPKAFEDRRILEGIIIKEDYLDTAWKQQPINMEFQPAIV